jgi:hypothetical protein
MDEIIPRSQAQLAKLQEQIETSRNVIEESKRWLTAYWASVNRERQNLRANRHFIQARARVI